MVYKLFAIMKTHIKFGQSVLAVRLVDHVACSYNCGHRWTGWIRSHFKLID
jgi:hypothetical protein